MTCRQVVLAVPLYCFLAVSSSAFSIGSGRATVAFSRDVIHSGISRRTPSSSSLSPPLWPRPGIFPLYAEEGEGGSSNEGGDASAKSDVSSQKEEKREDHGEHTGEEWQLPDEGTTDILNSPAFLRRKIDVLKSDIAKVEEEIDEASKALEAGKAEWGPQLDELQKEYVNIQERMARQSREGEGTAIIEVARKMLDTLDNFDRAFNAVTPETDAQREIEAAYKRAYQMIHDTFNELGITEVETLGKEFDYEVHQAVMVRPSDEYEEGIVCEELAKGYVLKDKLIRAAMVCVTG